MKVWEYWFWVILGCWFFMPVTAPCANLKDVLYDQYEIELNGFAEVRQGYRTGDDPYEKDTSISERSPSIGFWPIFLTGGQLR